MVPTGRESPLTREYWLGAVDARALSLFRISLGLLLLQDLWVRAVDRASFLTDDGVFPRSALHQPAPWSLFNLAGDASSVALLLAFGAVVTVAFTLGFATRLAAAASWLFWVSIHRRVPVIHTGGDTMADIFLFFGAFADLSGRWSLDALRRGARAFVPALAPRIMAALPALLYLYAAREKLKAGGKDWFFGPVIFEHMHLQGWLRPAGVWLGGHPTLCALFTGGTIVLELAIPFLFASPFHIPLARGAAAIGHTGLQLGILMTMKVGTFTVVMLAATWLWVLPEWFDAAATRLSASAARPAAVIGRSLAQRGAAIGSSPLHPRVQPALNALLLALFVAVALQPVVPRHLPRLVGPTVRFLGIDMATGLFIAGFPSVRWEAEGITTDGTHVDPLAVVAPEIGDLESIVNTQWMQLPYRLEEYGPLARFVCDRYLAGEHGALRSWTLMSATRPVYRPGEEAPPEVRKVLIERECIPPGTLSAGPK